MAQNNSQENATNVPSREERDENRNLDAFELREIDLETHEKTAKKQKVGLKEAKCDNINCMLSGTGKFALYLCYLCDIFLCEKCLPTHDETHEFVKVESDRSVREKMAEMFVGRMRSEKTRESNLTITDIKVYERKNVKHKFDVENCRVTELCGLKKKMWVVLDSENYCLKIFSSVSITLLKYVRFGSKPKDATEITVKKKSSDVDSVFKNRSSNSSTAQIKTDEIFILALTFPDIKQIWFIDANKTPVVKTNTIQMQKVCEHIEFSEDKLFTLCKEEVESGSRYSIDILSVNGEFIKVIQNPDLLTYISSIAVYKEKVYVTDADNNKVLCINIEDEKTIYDIAIEGSDPGGISMDQSNNLYMCGYWHNKVYRLSPDLSSYEPLDLDQEITRRPYRICFADGKLFIGHEWLSRLGNFITVVQLT